MFIREKIDQMRSSGSSIKDINDFRMAYDKGIAQGKAHLQALEFAHTCSIPTVSTGKTKRGN